MGLSWDFYFQKAVIIIPLQPNSKSPMRGFSWKEFDMWEYDWESHAGNIGLVCGQTNPEGTKRLCVVDLDAGKQPPYALRGFPPGLLAALEDTKTLCVATARNGLHFYTYVPVEMEFTVLRFRWGEVRCKDSYVVAPGSTVLLPDGKLGKYEFINLRQEEDFWELIHDAPPELLELVSGRVVNAVEPDPFRDEEVAEPQIPFSSSPPPKKESGGRVISIDPGPQTISNIINGVGEGESPCEGIRGRNDAAFHYAYYLLKRGETERTVWRVITEWNKRNRPPLPVKELKRTFQSACTYFVRHGGIIGAGNDLEDLNRSLETVWDRLKVGAEKIEPVYYPLAFRGGVTLLYGPPGEGKSYAMLRMAIATAKRGFKVVYLSLEMAESMVLSYLENMMQHDQIEPGGELYVVYKESELFAVPDADMIIVDALRTFRPNIDLNDSKQVEAFMQELRRNYGEDKSIVLLHHTNKPSMMPGAQEIDPRAMAEGSLRLVSASDIAAFFHRDTTVFLIDIVKSRYTATTTIKRRLPFPAKQIKIEGGEQIDW